MQPGLYDPGCEHSMGLEMTAGIREKSCLILSRSATTAGCLARILAAGTSCSSRSVTDLASLPSLTWITYSSTVKMTTIAKRSTSFDCVVGCLCDKVLYPGAHHEQLPLCQLACMQRHQQSLSTIIAVHTLATTTKSCKMLAMALQPEFAVMIGQLNTG